MKMMIFLKMRNVKTVRFAAAKGSKRPATAEHEVAPSKKAREEDASIAQLLMNLSGKVRTHASSRK